MPAATWLAVLPAGRARGGRKGRRAAGAPERPARRRGDAEAAARARRGFAEDPEHGMQWLKEGFESLESASRQHSPREGDSEYRALQFMDKVQVLTNERGGRAHVPISGNIYMYRAIAQFGACSDGANKALFHRAGPRVWIGIVLTMTIQVVAPMALCFWAVWRIDKIDGSWWGLSAWRYDYRSEVFGVSYILQRVLGILFLLLFTINGSYALKTDMMETEKMVCVVRAFDKVAKWYPYDTATGFGYKRPLECWLWVGAVVNSYVVVMLSICMFLIFVLASGEEGPKDIVFDAFGITFLYNLDDTTGELSFLEDIWDQDLMGDMYGGLEEDDELLDDIRLRRERTCTANNVYQCAVWIVNALTVALPLAFVFFQGKPVAVEWN